MKKSAALLLLLVLGLMMLPFVAHADDAVTDGSATGAGGYYLRLDAVNGTAEVWQETNNYPLLQIQGGTVTDDDGVTSTVAADTRVA